MRRARRARAVPRLAGLLAGAWLAAASAPVHAGIPEGVAWLVADQDASGLWGGAKGTPLRDAGAAVEILAALGQGAAEVASATAALKGTQTTSTDYLARKIVALEAGGEGDLAAVLGAELAAMRNADGGWGYRSGYASSNLETALALVALKRAGYTNNTVLAAGLGYLKTRRNADNAWSLTQGGTSEVFYTALGVIALTLHADVTSSATEVSAAVDWLRTQDHGDGGYGSAGTSNPYETGLAIAALVRGGWSGAEVTGARTYLENTQLGDGSWNGDAYRTAMALYGLHHVGPDASILPADIAFSNPSPLQGDVVQITATVRNLGAVAAGGVRVRFFDGDPQAGAPQIGADINTAAIPAGGSANAQVTWNTAGKAGDHTVHVVLDPLNVLLEAEEANNLAAKFIRVRFPADLQIAGDGIAFSPPEPDTTESVTIAITVKNAGENVAMNSVLQLWDGNPATGGIPLLGPGFTIGSIAAGSQFTLNVDMGNYFSRSGEYPIFACADVNATVTEIDENNNCNSRVLGAGRVRRSYTTYAGLDLLALPVTPLSSLTSYTLLPGIPNATRIDRWNRSTQSYQSAQYSGGAVVGSMFSIDLLDGYFAHIPNGATVDFVGRRVTTNPCTNLQTGLNIVSVPNENACYGAFDLVESLTGGVEAHRWNGRRQSWESSVNVGGTLVGDDFEVRPGSGYFVRVSSPSTWCVSPCDTVPSTLPDLRVTSADILLSPNPVAAGATVGIYVNIDNIGSVPVASPRLDIYVGDPGAGGTQLLGGNLPVTIPPGGSSGFWGNDFVFTSPGTYSIFGIADRLNAVTESDETNNQASAPLTVTASAHERPSLATARAVRDEDLPKIPVYRRLAAFAGAAGSAGDVRAPARVERGPGTRTAAGGAAAATRIQGVTVAGHSSSSATVTWVTDAAAGGCVRYGPTGALGFEACASGSDDLHVVTLEDLDPETSYSFKVVSDDLEDDNSGNLYTFRTTRQGAGLPSLAHGRVVETGTTTGVEGAAIFATLQGAPSSHPLVARSGPGGRFVLNLGNLKDLVTNDVLEPPASGTLLLRAEAANTGHGRRIVSYSGPSPRDLGDIELDPGLVEVPGAEERPLSFELRANLPNPFSEGTVIGFDLPVPSPVRLEVFDLQGRRVRLLEHRAEMAPGRYRVTWDGRDDVGRKIASGIYFYRLETGGFRAARKAILSRR